MAKELIIPQGIYKVGVDFPEGSYIFDSLKKDSRVIIDNDDYTSFDLDEECGYTAHVILKKNDVLTLESKMKVTKSEPINFDE